MTFVTATVEGWEIIQVVFCSETRHISIRYFPLVLGTVFCNLFRYQSEEYITVLNGTFFR